MKGHTIISRAKSLFAIASTAVVAAACASSFARAGVTPTELVEMEDRIDGLEPGKQVDEYLELRKLLLKADAKGGPQRSVVLSRLALKLALANVRAANPNPDRAGRLDFCKRAAEIGESYLKQADPARALAWERICNGIEERSQWASVLRNSTHKWFENRLYRQLVARDWSRARLILQEWRGLLASDHAVDEGIGAYASARAEDLEAVLAREGADAALSSLNNEEERHPGLEAWAAMRRKIAESLQQPFDKAVSERNVDEAEAALVAQKKISKRFALSAELAPVDENRKRLNELAKALEPAPLLRPYGFVRSPAFRLDIGATLGTVDFSDRDESIQDDTTMLAFALDYRQRGGDRKRWYGANISVLSLDATEGLASGDASIVALNGLVGVSRDKWAAWTGLGLAFADVSYTGLSFSDSGSGTILGNIKLGGEYAPKKTFTVYGDLDFGGSSDLSHWQVRLGARYYANPNFAIGLQYLATGVKARDDSTGADIKGSTSGLGFNVVLQF